MRVVFMGTPDFAVPSLEALAVRSEHQIVGVVTVPDRKKGRGLKVEPSPVKSAALQRNLLLLQPERFSNTIFVRQLHKLKADLFVVVAFRILPKKILSIPPLGAINLHPSLLPLYRGPAPIQWAIINGDTETGLTTIMIDQRVDAGEILLQESVLISPQETAGALHDRLAQSGADLLLRTTNLIGAGDLPHRPQQGPATQAPKINKADGLIDWTRSARDIHNLIRGLNPYPMAYTVWKEKRVRVLESIVRVEEDERGIDPGRSHDDAGLILAEDAKQGILVQTGKGGLWLVQVHPEGRRKMLGADFLRGYRAAPGNRFGPQTKQYG